MVDLENLSPESVVTGAAIASLLMISPRRVEQLAAAKVIPREGRGRYRVDRAVAGYVEFLREPGYRRQVAEEARGLDPFDFD